MADNIDTRLSELLQRHSNHSDCRDTWACKRALEEAKSELVADLEAMAEYYGAVTDRPELVKAIPFEAIREYFE